LFNHDHTKGAFPALRAGLTTASNQNIELTWVGFLLPFMEQNPAWNAITSANTANTNLDTVYELVIPIL